MPTYEYHCDACEHNFDEFQSFSDKPLKKCPKCRKSKLRRVFGTGAAILLITHDLGVVAETADEVAVMYAGRIVETGTVPQVFAEPHHPYTRGLLGSMPRVGSERTMLMSIEGTPPSLTALPAGCAFHPRCAFATERCRAERPPIEAFSDHRTVACIHHREVAAMAEAA